jgi:hypothetical protein
MDGRQSSLVPLVVYREHITAMRQTIDAQAAEITRLRALLPQTADGVLIALHLVLRGDELLCLARSRAEAKGFIGLPVESGLTRNDGLRIETVTVSVPKEPTS